MPDCNKPLTLRKVVKAITELYEGMSFKCSDCHATYQYNQHVQHKSYCLLKAALCIFKCGDGRMYKNRAEHANHVKTDCRAVPLVCKKCLAKTTRAEYPAHDCMPGLLQQVSTAKDFSNPIIATTIGEISKKHNDDFERL